jgi:predicted ATPase
MNKIGFSNFRRFLKFEPIEFKGITFLVGRNNSGKSTVEKALLLINDYFKSGNISTFSFGNNVLEDANIVTYGRAKNRRATYDFIAFTYIFDKYHIEITISGDEDNTTVDVHHLLIIDTSINLNFHFEPLSHAISISKTNLLDWKLEGEIDTNIKKLDIEIKNLKEKINSSDLKKSSREYISQIEELNSIQKKKDSLVKDKESDKFESVFSYTTSYSEGLTMKEIISSTIVSAMLEHDKQFREIQNGKKPSKNFADYRAIWETREVIEKSFEEFFNYVTEFSSVIYLGANPAKQSALFPIRERNNALAQSIHDFYQLKISPGEPAYEFVLKWMKEFEVGESFLIDIHAGEAYEVKIFSNDTNIHLADKGMGSVQAMLLILRLASIIHKTIDTDDILTIIIEEPELNLHPALQSKLADLFLEVYEKCYHDFIIETHSEYLVRRSQVLVAEKEFEVKPNINPFVVYYFPKDLEYQPYQLEYQKDGTFNKNFGEGFFDEASASTLELLKLQRQKKG